MTNAQGVQEAKQRFSEVIPAADSSEHQIVTRRGEKVAVAFGIAEYPQLRDEARSFMEYMRADTSADADFECGHQGLPRDVDLVGIAFLQDISRQAAAALCQLLLKYPCSPPDAT